MSTIDIENYSKVTVRRIRTTEITTDGLHLNGQEPSLDLISNVAVNIPDCDLVIGSAANDRNVLVYGGITSNNLTVYELVDIQGTANIEYLNVLQDATIASLTVTGDVSLDSNLTVSGKGHFLSDLEVDGDVIVNGNLRVTTLTSDNTSQEVTSEAMNLIDNDNDTTWSFKLLTNKNLGLYYNNALKFEWAPL